jgi:hypothetical protein
MKRFILLVISAVGMAVSIILMALLKGIVMVFASSPGQRIYVSFSNFDSIIFGYGNWFPLISAVMAVIALILILWSLIRYKNFITPNNASLICSILSISASLLSFIIFHPANTAGIVIVTLLIISTISQAFANKQMSG